MWQCGHHRSYSNGGARSDNRMALAYCSRSWGRLDSGTCEPHEYGEAHKWGTWGGGGALLMGVSVSPAVLTLGGSGGQEGQFNLTFL